MEENSNVYTIGGRNIYISGKINSDTTSKASIKLMEAIINISNQASVVRDFEVGHINIFIQSPGGSVHDMWGLIDLMLSSPIPIYTYAIGLAESAALMIFLAGSVRYVLPNTTLMYHEVSAGNKGKLQDVAEWHDYLAVEQEKLENFVKARTFIKPKLLKEIKEKKMDYYMQPKDAINLRFATDEFRCVDWSAILLGKGDC